MPTNSGLPCPPGRTRVTAVAYGHQPGSRGEQRPAAHHGLALEQARKRLAHHHRHDEEMQ